MIKLRAFLVEDSPVLLESLTAALEELADVQVVGSADSEQAALAWLNGRTDGCDVAVIDVFLKSGSGLGVLQGMHTFAPPPERVVLTNYATADMRERCNRLGAEQVFDKSTEFEELVDWFRAKRSRRH